MNVILLNSYETGPEIHARLEAAAGRPVLAGRMCHAVGSDGPPALTLRFSSGQGVARTRRETGGLLCAALLTVDEFPGDEELVILSAEPPLWSRHFQRLYGAAACNLDVFLSFETEGSSELIVDPDVSALLHLTNGVAPALAWYRTTDLFYQAAKQVIRKDSRWNGQFTADALLRELALHDARVGYHGRAAGPALAAA